MATEIFDFGRYSPKAWRNDNKAFKWLDGAGMTAYELPKRIVAPVA